MDYDVLVIGSGNTGNAAAKDARRAGRRVVVVEKRELGGTCPLRGCVPKKVLIAAAEVLDTVSRARVHGIDAQATLDWGALIARERKFVEGTPRAVEDDLRAAGIDVVRGEARFVDPHAVDVAGRRITASKIVVATGSIPQKLHIPGAEHLWTSDDLLERTTRPDSIVFVGAGVIAFEFAHVLARAGTKVTLIEAGERPLGRREADVVDRLVTATRALGIHVATGTKVEAIEKRDTGFAVRVRRGNTTEVLETDAVAHGAGRVPDWEGLGLDAAGIEVENGKVALDSYLRSRANPDIFFGGDGSGAAPQLSPIATYHGHLIGRQLAGSPPVAPDYDPIPAVVFTIPPFASVGKTEEAARAAGLDVDVHAGDRRSWRSARTYAEDYTFSKVLVEKGSGRIVGAHLLGRGASETIHAFAFAMKHGVTAEALKETVYAYPTDHADVPYLL